MVAALRFELSLRSNPELPLLIRQPMHHTSRGLNLNGQQGSPLRNGWIHIQPTDRTAHKVKRAGLSTGPVMRNLKLSHTGLRTFERIKAIGARWPRILEHCPEMDSLY